MLTELSYYPTTAMTHFLGANPMQAPLLGPAQNLYNSKERALTWSQAVPMLEYQQCDYGGSGQCPAVCCPGLTASRLYPEMCALPSPQVPCFITQPLLAAFSSLLH